MRLLPRQPAAPHRPFIIAALLFTLGPGALTGALDLWHLRVVQRAVPLDHHQAHGLTQLFGFMWLFTAGVAFQLAPRLLGTTGSADPRVTKVTAGLGIGGVLLLILGRLGSLLPGSTLLGPVGALGLLAAVLLWADVVLRLFRRRGPQQDRLAVFVMMGTGWWALSATCLLLQQLGQVSGGPLRHVPLEAVYAAALYGGTASWLLGISFRAGACTLQVDRPSLRAQTWLVAVWQVAAMAQVGAALGLHASLSIVAPLSTAVGLLSFAAALRPWRSRSRGETLPGPAIRQTMLVAHGFGVVTAVLMIWRSSILPFTPVAPLLVDSSRHAFTLGFAQLMVLAFAGRMLPGFEARALPRPAVFNVGVALIAVGAALRVFSVFGPWGPAMRAAGLSGFTAWVGLLCVATSVLALFRSTPAHPSHHFANRGLLQLPR